jgi:AraC-like DNA-binding protein
MDTLTEVLQTVHIKSTACYRVDLSAPWGFRLNSYGNVVFCVITQGSCWLNADGLETPMPLMSGDLVVLPHGDGCILQDDPKSVTLDREVVLSKHLSDDQDVLRFGGGGVPTTIVCGRLHFENLRTNPLLSALPPLILVKGEDGQAVEWLNTTLEFIARETALSQPGGQLVINHLCGILFIQAVRVYVISKSTCDKRWLRALVNPQIGIALSLIHRRPEEPWTVASLASRVGMSRSAFSARFVQVVGESPLQYVTRWRMHKAAYLLRLDRGNLAQVAELVGYRSEAAFSKAFKNWMNKAPGAYRRDIRSSVPSPAY